MEVDSQMVQRALTSAETDYYVFFAVLWMIVVRTIWVRRSCNRVSPRNSKSITLVSM